MDGTTARLLAKRNNHKLAVKMCRKAERTKSVKSGTQLHVVKVNTLIPLFIQISYLKNFCYFFRKERSRVKCRKKNREENLFVFLEFLRIFGVNIVVVVIVIVVVVVVYSSTIG